MGAVSVNTTRSHMKSNAHDPLDQNIDENEISDIDAEKVTDTSDVTSAEESAINTDTEVALEATEELGTDLSEEVEAGEEAEEVVEKKHKNRESTAEKAKKAAIEREKKGEAVSASGAPIKKLDPLRKRGKNYRAKFALVNRTQVYSIDEAIELVKQTTTTKFNAAVEMHVKIKGDNVRGTVVLPHGNGKTKKVAVADDETIQAISEGKIDFEVLLAVPAQMPKLARYAKLLGPKGLMPSPKAGTVTDDIEKVKKEIEGGRVEYRADKNKVVHLSIGKVNFTNEQIKENYQAIEQILTSQKIVSISLASTMGPGIKVQLTK